MDDTIQDLIDGAYAAALDDGLWADWVWQVTRLLGGICGTLYVVEASGRIRHQAILHDNAKAVERYIDENIGRFDPQVAYVTSLPSPSVYADTDHVDRDDPGAREYFDWQAANGKLQHYITAPARLNGGAYFAGLSVHRHVDEGPTPDLSRRIMERLQPHIHRALELGFLHAEKLTEAYWEGMLTRRHEACLLLDDDGRVLRATSAMEGLLMRGDGLGYAQGRLTRGGGKGNAQLDGFIATLTLESATPCTCRLDRPSGKAAYVLTGYPLPRRMRMLAPVEAVALVTVIDPAAFIVPTTERWRTAYGLTSREQELARLLLTGHSVETAAEAMAITDATARVHVRNLFAKTATSRQSELILLLSRLSA